MTVEVSTKRCRYCAEEIQAEAVLCRHCGRSQRPPLNGLSVWAFVANLLLPPVSSILAIVLGIRARRLIRERGERGDALAVAALVWGWTVVSGFVVVLLGVGIWQLARVDGDELDDAVVNVAFAERDYHEKYGTYTANLDDLVRDQGLRVDDRIEWTVFADGENFCVSGVVDNGDNVLTTTTKEDAFTDDGSAVYYREGAGSICEARDWRRPFGG